MQRRLEQLERQQAQAAKQPPVSPADKKQLEQMVTKMFEENKSDFVAPDWVNNLKWSGDLRYRYESLNDTGSGTDNVGKERRRNRIRARLGLKAKVTDEVDAIFRIASGSTDTPTSTNQTLDNTFESKDLWLDLGYVDWHPDSYPGLNVYAGKMKNPFYRVGKNQVIWDSDVNPEGGAFSYSYDMTDSDKATITAAAFWLDARDPSGSNDDADASYIGIQAMLKHKFDNGSYLTGGASFYDIGNIDSKSSASDDTGVTLNGNTDAGGNIYRYDYDMVEGFAEYGFKCNGMPVAVFGNYVENIAAPESRNTAYSIGAQLNKASAKKPGSWQLKASYCDVESDAVFGGLSNSDFIDGGTGGRGWILGYKYQIAKNIQGSLTYFINNRDRRLANDNSGGSGEENFNRLQADLIFKF